MSLFDSHLLNEQGIEYAESIALKFNNLLNGLEMFCADSPREFAIVKTKLEEACFFAKKAMALQTKNQQL